MRKGPVVSGLVAALPLAITNHTTFAHAVVHAGKIHSVRGGWHDLYSWTAVAALALAVGYEAPFAQTIAHTRIICEGTSGKRR